MSRFRRVSGNVLLALGVLLVARMLWLQALYGKDFGEVEWIRFSALSWLGVLLASLGCWLRFRSMLAAGMAAVLFAVPGVMILYDAVR
jgi:hypothetical protein